MNTDKHRHLFEELGDDHKERVGTFVETAFSNEEVASAIAEDARRGIREVDCAFLTENKVAGRA